MSTKKLCEVVRRLAGILSVAVVLGGAIAVAVPAQIVSGTIVGTVTDSTGAVVPAVTRAGRSAIPAGTFWRFPG